MDIDAQARCLLVYSLANLNCEFLARTSVGLDGAKIGQQNTKLSGEVGLGGTNALNDKWSVNGEASNVTSLHRTPFTTIVTRAPSACPSDGRGLRPAFGTVGCSANF
jgi:hypothetical protein